MDKHVLAEKIDKLQGKVGFYYKNLVDGSELCYNEEEVYTSASIIKVPIFMTVMKLAEEGRFNLSDKILVKDEDKEPGCGALKSFTGDVEVDIETLCKLMITISDNTATNMLIKMVGIEELGAQFRAMGLEKTQVQRCFFDDEADARGLSNVVSTKEIGKLFVMIAERSFVNEKVSEKIEEVLLLQQIRHKIPGYIGRGMKIANKTGEVDGVTHDGAIVYAKKPFVLVITSDETDVAETERFIRQIALDLYNENGGN